MKAVQEESEREKEGLLGDIRHVNKELDLESVIIDSYIPQEYQQLIQQHAIWDEDEGEWHMVREVGVAYDNKGGCGYDN